jgi:acetyl-CoA carboxylase carboxyl transferase subunit beta
MKLVKANYYKCPKCDYHIRIGSHDYFDIIFDGNFEELFANLISKDSLNFTDLKPYTERLAEEYKKTGLLDAMSVATGELAGKKFVVAAMDFSFIGGSMGSVVGEKIAKSIDYCIENRAPLLIISKSGGARMMEAAFSLMQMGKTAAKLTQLSRAGLPYFSLLTDPTTGGVTASFAMLGDLNFAEPKALIGFAGPRVIKETIKQDLPEGFQTSEFLLEKGFIDFIVNRKDLKSQLESLLRIFPN